MAPSKLEILNMVTQIPCFEGNRDASLADRLAYFLLQVRNRHDTLEPDGQEFFMSVIPERFTGEALATMYFKSFKKLEDLEDHLSRLYEPRRDPADILRELSTCQQCLGEAIVSFAERVNKLSRQALSLMRDKYSGADMSVTKSYINEQAKKAFIYGLRSGYVRTALCHQSEKELSELIEEAIKWENIERISNAPNHSFRTELQVLSFSYAQQEASTERLFIELSERIELLEKSASNHKECWFCRKQGHLPEECHALKTTPFCDICEEYYHNSDECPQNFSEKSHYYNEFFQSQNFHYCDICGEDYHMSDECPQNFYGNLSNGHRDFNEDACFVENTRYNKNGKPHHKQYGDFRQRPNLNAHNSYDNTFQKRKYDTDQGHEPNFSGIKYSKTFKKEKKSGNDDGAV